LVWEKQDADRRLAKVEDAFKNIKAFDTWVGARFTKLEALVKEITPLLGDKDPQKLNIAFYLFFWKFVPLLCGCFPVAICCGDASTPPPDGSKSPHIGCGRGDWRPSVIDDETLRKLLCCAWYEVLEQRDEAQQKNAAVEAVKASLDYIKSQVPKDDAVDDTIEGRIEKIKCAAATTSARETAR
jgi:hypothetical protein